MTNLEAKQALARKLDISYSDIANNGLFADSDLQAYIQTGAHLAWDRHSWDFTEGAKTSTLSSGNIIAGYMDYPSDMVTGGAISLDVKDEEFPEENKLRYRDYIRWKQQNATAQDKYWSEYKRFIFINMNAVVAGDDFAVYGKLRCITLSADGDLLPFSPDSDNQEDSGNMAIVDLAFAEVLESDKKKDANKAEIMRKKAFAQLDKLWEPMKAYQTNQQMKDRPFFDVPDFFAGHGNSSKNNIGNFN